MNSPSEPIMVNQRNNYTPEMTFENTHSNPPELIHLNVFQLPPDVFALPSPITIRLLTIGVSHNIAEMMSNAYLEEAQKLKELTEGVVTKTLKTLHDLSVHDTTQPIALLRQQIIQVHQSKYRESLSNWENQAESLALSRLQPTAANEQVQTSHPSKKLKRHFKSEYLPLFEFAFSKDRFPSREDKKHLARISGMSYRQISVWFQNRRCRSGKCRDGSPVLQTSGEAKTRSLECTRSSTTKRVAHCQRNISVNKEGEAVVHWEHAECSSPNIIDLTIEEKSSVTYADTPFSEDEKEAKPEPEEISILDTLSVVSDTENNGVSLFPAPYVPSVSDSDLFTLKTDPSLWRRQHGVKRRRSSERNIRVEDVISDLESMNVTSRLPNELDLRPTKSLPKRNRTRIFDSSPTLTPRRSFSCGSESSVYSSDEPSFSPLSRASSYSTVVSSALPSPELSEIDLSPARSEWDEEVEDRCSPYHPFETTTSCGELRHFETIDHELPQDEIVDFDNHDNRHHITRDIGSHFFKPGPLHLQTTGWNGLLAA